MLRRAAFGQGPKVYRFGDSTLRGDWDAGGSPGAGGVQKIAGSTVINSLSEPPAPPPLPPGTLTGIPLVSAATVTAPDVILLTLDAPPDPAWRIYARLSRRIGAGAVTPSHQTPFALAWDGGQVLTDFAPLYFAHYPALVVGEQLVTQLRLEYQAAWGATLSQQFWPVE